MSTAASDLPLLQNPLLDSDWPDLDVAAGPDGYVMVVSSSHRSPGLPVLVSDDLVSWRIASRAIVRLADLDSAAGHERAEPAGPAGATTPRHGGGVWAPSVRHHGGRWFAFVPDPDVGVFVVDAEDPAGPWSPPRLLLAGPGIIDPCPVWDEGGHAWLLFAWAKSRSGVNNRLSLIEMDEAATTVRGRPVTVVDGDAVTVPVADGGPAGRMTVLEGPKVYRRGGWWWIFAPAGGVVDGWQSVFRSRELTGPYEHRILLRRGSSDVNGPHQGALVHTPEGEDFFLHFQDRGAYGRVVHLQPVRWGDDGWPVIGDAGEPAAHPPMPSAAARAALGGRPREFPATSDGFTGTDLALQWAWQADPSDDWIELRGDGTVRLRLVPSSAVPIRALGSVLTQPLPGWPCSATTTVELPVDAPVGARAGLAVVGLESSWAGLEVGPDGQWLVVVTGDGGADAPIRLEARVALSTLVTIRVISDGAGSVVLAARAVDGPSLESDAWPARAGHWTSAELGLFAARSAGQHSALHAVFGAFDVDFPDRA